jgi:twitching motility protein PilU
LLRLMSQKKGSTCSLPAGFPPAIKIDGKVTPVSNQVLTSAHSAELARSIMNDRQAAEFEATKECNFAISPPASAVSGSMPWSSRARGVVCRTINMSIPTLDELQLPPVLKDLAMTKRGLSSLSAAPAPARPLRWRPGRLPQRKFLRSHHHHRRPDRIRA